MKELFESKSNSSFNVTNPLTSSPSSSTIASSQSEQLSHGEVAGIVIGCAAFIVICASGVVSMMKRKPKNKPPVELSDRSPQMLPSKPQLIELSAEQGELSAEQGAPEILTEHQDRTELPARNKRFAAELSSGAPIGHELHR